MDMTVGVVGETTHQVHTDNETTSADLLAAINHSPQAVSMLIDGSPVAEDQPVGAETVGSSG